jgi:hypothetical protein
MIQSYHFLVKSIIWFFIFLFLLSLEFSAFGQNYPLRSIDSLQWVHPDTLLTGKTLSRYVGDTVRVRGLVILNPRDHALSTNWKATYLVDTQSIADGVWKGLVIRLPNLADSTAIGFFSNFQVGNFVECTGVVTEFQDASPNSGETQLNLIGVASSVLGFATPPAPRLSFMNQFMVYDPNNPSVPQQIQKPTGEPYEGMYVQFNNVLVTNVSTFSGGRVSWMIRDASGSEINVRDAVRFFRPPFVSSTASVPPNPGAPVFVQQGKVFSHVRGVITETNFASLYPRYEIIPLTPSDLGSFMASPPFISLWKATPAVPRTANPVTIGARIVDLDGSVASAKLFYAPGVRGGVYDSLPMTLVAPDSFQATIPGSVLTQNGAYYHYYIRATDNQNNNGVQPDTLQSFGLFRVMNNGINRVSDIQETPVVGGRSIFADVVLDSMQLRGRIMSTLDPSDYGRIIFQDGVGPWTGITLRPDNNGSTDIDTRLRGDSVWIKKALVIEDFGITTLVVLDYAYISPGQPYQAFRVPIDSIIARSYNYTEPHESSLLIFDSVYVVNQNPDAPSNFGEFSIYPDSAVTTGLRVRGGVTLSSLDLGQNFNTDSLTFRQRLCFILGILTFNYNNWKLQPRNRNDVDGFGNSIYCYSLAVRRVSSCYSDTVTVPVNNGTLNGVANAALRMTYNADSLTYVGSSNLNSAFNGMVVNGGNGVVTLDWNTSTNQNIAAGNMVNLRFRVNGSSALTWDTLVYPSEFSDVNFNVVPQTFQNGGITNRTLRYHEQRQICQGQTLQMGGQTFSTGGNYQVVLPGSGTDCDTLVNLTLSVLPTQTSISATTCSNQPYSFDGQNLNVSGVYRDTLINVLGCDSVVTLNLTVRPAYSQTISVVNCPGTSYNFGNQVLTTSGIYTNTFSTIDGCDSVVQLNLTFADSIQIVAQGGLNGFCPGGSLRIGTLSSSQQGTYQWKFNGNIIGTANTDTLLVNQAGTYQAEMVLTPTCTLYSNILNVSVLNCNQITGDLRYDNTNLTPLAGVPVELKTLLGNVVAADTTDSSGNYSMSGYANGNYILDARIGYNSGGINSTDALLVNRYFTSLISLTPLRARAGDVNGNQITNSGDALLISRRITNLVSSFSVGNYVNDKPTINAQGNPLSVSMRALSTGDVNGSFIVQPSAPTLVLDTVYGNGNVGTAVVRFTNPGSGVFERGIVWSSSPNPTIASNKSLAGKGGYGFTHSFGGLTSGSLYYVRAYARTSAGVYYSTERSFQILGIGSNYAGGIVFDLDSSGQHGLVCAPSDLGCYGTDIPNTSTAVGTGATNTAYILAGCTQRPIAASVCADLVLNGYSDWYLPSRGELQLMYSRLHTQGLGGFVGIWYWSSSQYGPYVAWSMNFSSGNVNSSGKFYNYQVRAVRAF